jgi:threonine/homoserine/homoserine lactone efflux protein
MSVIITFSLAYFFSFIGSIPPGTINLLIVQLGLDKKFAVAWRFAIAAALIEYPYAWLAIKFKSLILSSPTVLDNLLLITAIVMIVLGLVNVIPTSKASSISQRFESSGFRRGLLLAILNPLAIPYWFGVTAYLEAQGWIDLSSTAGLHSYLTGVSLGSLSILVVLTYLAAKAVNLFKRNDQLKKIPGYILLVLGVYALIRYFY